MPRIPQIASLSLSDGKSPQTEPATAKSSKPERKQPRTVRLTVSLPGDLVDRLRDAVYWSPDLKLAWLIAQSLRASLADLETSRRGPFPKRMMALRSGRPRLIGQSMKVPLQAKSSGDGGTHQAQASAQVGLGSQPSVD